MAGHATPGPVQGNCDVAVIGGGLTGSSAALTLAKKGACVVLLEAETIGGAWPVIPDHFGPPWFLPLVGAYYRLKDKLS